MAGGSGTNDLKLIKISTDEVGYATLLPLNRDLLVLEYNDVTNLQGKTKNRFLYPKLVISRGYLTYDYFLSETRGN